MGASADTRAHLVVECEEILLDYVGQHPAQTRTAQAKSTTYRLMSCIHASRVKSARSAWCVAWHYGGTRLLGEMVSYPVRIELPYFLNGYMLHCIVCALLYVLYCFPTTVSFSCYYQQCCKEYLPTCIFARTQIYLYNEFLNVGLLDQIVPATLIDITLIILAKCTL